MNLPQAVRWGPCAARRWFAANVVGLRYDAALVFSLQLVIIGLVLLPMGYLAYGALRSAPPFAAGGVFTFENLKRVFLTSELVKPLLNTVSIGLVVGAVSVALGSALAWLVERTELPHAMLLTNLLVVPFYLSTLMLSLAWIAVGAPRVGFINALSQVVGGPASVIDIYSFWGIVWVLATHYTPYVFLHMLGPIKSMDASLEEASLVLGASRWRTLVRVDFGLLLPAMFANFVMVAALAAENFPVPVLLGRRLNLAVIPSEIYFWLTYEPSNPNMAAAASFPLLVLTLLGIRIYRRMTALSNRYVTVTGKSYRPVQLKASRGRWIAALVVWLYLIVALFLPVGGLVLASLLRYTTSKLSWSILTLDNYSRVFSSRSNLLALQNSLVLGVSGATIGTLLGVAISYAVHRTRGPLRASLDYLASASVAIPGIVLGVGMLWTYVRIPWLYGTIWVLLISYLARYLAHSVRVIGSSTLQLSGELDEAGQVLGVRAWRRWRDLLFPLIRPAMFGSFLLLFIFILNEISSTVVLYSPRSVTLSVVVWQALDMYGPTQAFVFAVTQVLCVFVVLLLAYRLGRPIVPLDSSG